MANAVYARQKLAAKRIKQNDRCRYCQREVRPETKIMRPVLEHYLPRHRMKSGDRAHTVMACAWCDKAKGMMHGDDFLALIAKHTVDQPFGNKAMSLIRQEAKQINNALHKEYMQRFNNTSAGEASNG
jgi:hypothetical protein